VIKSCRNEAELLEQAEVVGVLPAFGDTAVAEAHERRASNCDLLAGRGYPEELADVSAAEGKACGQDVALFDYLFQVNHPTSTFEPNEADPHRRPDELVQPG
jgi:hypothetical protein